MQELRLGLKENWQQFSLLVLVNMMVGGMVGLERTVVPLVGTQVFGIASDIVIFSFIIAFGVVKAFTNLVSGVLADRYYLFLFYWVGDQVGTGYLWRMFY